MKLVQFTYTNEYDKQSSVQVNPAFVVSLRPESKTQTRITLVSGPISVDGTIAVVSEALCGDDRATVSLDTMPDSG